MLKTWCSGAKSSVKLCQYNPRSQTSQFNFRYFIGGKPILQKQQVKDLGILIFENLNFHVQVSEASKRPHRFVGDISKLEKLQNKMTKLLHHGNILSPQERNNVLRIKSHEQSSW